MDHYNVDNFNFFKAAFGDTLECNVDCKFVVFKILSVVNHECGEGFVVAFHPDGSIWIFCFLEGGYSVDAFNLSEVMRQEAVTEAMSKRLYDNISSFIRNHYIDTKEDET